MALRMDERKARMLAQGLYVVGGKVMEMENAAKLIRSGSTVTFSGISQVLVPDAMLGAVEKRFLAEEEPRDLTLAYPMMSGGGPKNGVEHLAHKGMVRRVIGCNFYGELYPEISKLIRNNEIEAYMFPLGTYLHLFREVIRGNEGLMTQVGLGTFVDPRLGGGKLNAVTKEDLIELVQFRGQDYLFYKAFPIDVAIIKGTTADEEGNISLEEEPLTSSVFLYAMLAKACRGLVIAQVKKVVKAGNILPAHLVKVPGILVDAVVVDENQRQLENIERFDPRLSGIARMPLFPQPALALDAEKIICRRAMLELKRGWVINFGAGLPIQRMPLALLEENIQDLVSISVEHGALGGTCLGSYVHYNPTSFLDSERVFDLYVGGGYDACFLGCGEVDAQGNVNMGLLDGNWIGGGGAMDICHRVPRIYYLTKFTTDGLEITTGNGEIRIHKEGRKKKFIRNIQQVTIHAGERLKRKQQVKFITERGVLRLESRGLFLEEIAPGINLEEDILKQAEYEIFVDDHFKEMDRIFFTDQPLNLRERLLQQCN